MLSCPDCDEPLAFTYRDTSGVGAHKRGDHYNTTPDTDHYICFPPVRRPGSSDSTGPLTPDVVGDLAFFTCRVADCGERLGVTHESTTPADVRLTCPRGHQHEVAAGDGGGLVVVSV